MGNIFDILLINPLTNALMLLYGLLGNSYVLAIIVLTLIIRLITLPLTLRQQISSYKMQAMQPQMKALQEKYKNDPQTLQAEMRKLGFNPLSGCLPLLIQFPILIGLYQAITRTLATTPLSLLELGSHVYSFLPNISKLVPINSTFFIWGSEPAGPVFHHSSRGGGDDVFQQQADDAAEHGPNDEADQPDDAVDDAADVRLLHAEHTSWPRHLLDCVEPRGRAAVRHHQAATGQGQGAARCAGWRRPCCCRCDGCQRQAAVRATQVQSKSEVHRPRQSLQPGAGQ